MLSNGEKLGREEGVLKFDERAVAVSDVCVFLSSQVEETQRH